jgi:DNA (cytosine-5)-methyltransferase 1
MTSDPTYIVSLFSGCGGMDLGFEQKGFRPIIAVDNDEAAVESFNGNRLAKVAQLGDLSTLSGYDIIHAIEKQTPGARPRGVIGGPPCQSFSQSNVHGRPGDPRHQLPLHTTLTSLCSKMLLVLSQKSIEATFAIF